VLFVGDDWAEAHHDIEIETDEGRVVARRRLPEGLAGITMLHELVASLWIRQLNRIRCSWALRPSVGRGCRRC
jgi:hypothetical protein